VGRFTEGERNVKSASYWPKLLFEAHGQITKTIGESGRGVVVDRVVRGRKTELGLAGDSKSHGCLWEIKAALASIAGLLKPILKLQAATKDDDTRICDLRPVCGNRGLRIGAASLSFRLRARVPVVTERNNTKRNRSMQKIVRERLGFSILAPRSKLRPFPYAFFIYRVLKWFVVCRSA
jgi:hypothetical protein